MSVRTVDAWLQNYRIRGKSVVIDGGGGADSGSGARLAQLVEVNSSIPGVETYEAEKTRNERRRNLKNDLINFSSKTNTFPLPAGPITSWA